MFEENLLDSSYDLIIKVGKKTIVEVEEVKEVEEVIIPSHTNNPFRNPEILNKIRNDINHNYKEFYVHSFILLKNIKSKYFYNILECDTRKECERILLELPEIDPSIFEVILEFAYWKNLDINDFTTQKIMSLLFTSSFLDLKNLITHLFTYNFPKIIHALNTSYLFDDNQIEFSLKNEIYHRKCIVNQLCLEYSSNIFNSNDYLSFHKGFIYDILSSNDLIMNELEIWKKLIKWGIINSNISQNHPSNVSLSELIKDFSNKDFKKLEEKIKDLIPLIRFYQINLDDYFKNIGNPFKNILPKGLNENVFKYHMKKEISFKNNNVLLSPRKYQKIDSTIIVGEQTALLAKWIKECNTTSNVLEELLNEEKYFEFKLLLRGSKDGFDTGIFHKKCDGIDNTIIIIKIKDSDEIVGGYNPFSWQSLFRVGFQSFPYEGYNVPCSSSFLFSLKDTLRENCSTLNVLSKINENQVNEAIYYSQIDGPKFGKSDLHLINNIRHDIKDWDYNRLINNKEKLFGHCKEYSYSHRITDKTIFEIEDYEVFQVVAN